MTIDLAGRTAVVTGATGGMGQAITRGLAAAGANVVAADIADVYADELIASTAESPGSVSFIAGDISQSDHVSSIIAQATSLHTRLDYGVNAAAIEFETAPLAECSDDEFDKMMAVNVRGVFLAMKQQIRAMLAHGEGGSIVNIASSNSFRPQHNQPAYTASKHAVLGLTRSAAIDYARQGIRVNAVCPGAIDTPMLRTAMQRRNRKVEDVANRLSYLGRFGEPDEIADAVMWLLSDASSFTTGHALTVDGGMLAG